MNGVPAAILVVLGLAAPLHTPDLQVEVVTASGTPLPELVEAVSRALVAGGARVVLRGPTSGACEYCAVVRVVERTPEVCEVEVRHEQHMASTKLHLPAGSQLFDRARAIAIQARLLMTWQAAPESKAKEVSSRPVRTAEARHSEARTPTPGAASPTSGSAPPKIDSLPYLATQREHSAGPIGPVAVGSAAPPVATPLAVVPSSLKVESPPVVSYTSRSDGMPVPRTADSKPPTRIETKTTAALEGASGPAPAAKPVAETLTTRKPRADLAEVQASEPPSPRRWLWIPTAIGAGAGVAAGICAGISRGHYNALSDKTQSLESARSEKSAGERWQTASLVLAGAALVGIGTGIVGFATGSSEAGQVKASATALPGGGMVALAGSFP